MRWLLVGVFGCAGKAVPTAGPSETSHYSVSIEAEFGVITDPATDTVMKDAVEATLQLRAALTPVRRFRDGSVGQLFEIEDGAMELDGEPYTDLELTGRAIELRTFPDGEILMLGWGSKLAGPQRFMDAFEVVFPGISPAPPSLEPGQVAKRRIIWPHVSTRKLRWDSAVNATWRNEGSEEVADTTAWRIGYSGPWRIHGGRRAGADRLKVSASGATKGEVWFDAEDGGLVKHEFEWTRLVEIEGAAGALVQAQGFKGKIERLVP